MVVGLIVFLILVVIQFVVITNGAGRVAEVGARFTLDAMPGKQMAIDADLNAGQITEEEARERREDISREADFYGAMDGASKFVKGDAIAAILITLINLIGGIIVGVAQQGMPFSEAVQHFSLLTVGDGLTAQIPALLISVATGILVTRSASEGRPRHRRRRTRSWPRSKAPMVAGVVICAFALVPGLPKLPFLVIGGALLPRRPRAEGPPDRRRGEGRRRRGRRAGRAARPAVAARPGASRRCRSTRSSCASASASCRSSTRAPAARCCSASAPCAARSPPSSARSSRRSASTTRSASPRTSTC